MKRIFIFAFVLLIIISLYSNEKPIPDTFFGLHQHRIVKGKKPKPWASVPFKTWRLWDTGIIWAEIQPEKDKWDFSLVDRAVKLAEEHDVEIIIGIGLTPAWAAKNPKKTAAYGNPTITISPPKNIEDWKIFVRKIATRYKGKIKYWEIWNEPDHFHFYHGKVEELVELVKEAYIILKEVDPGNMIISPPVTGYPALLSYVDKFLSAGGKDYVDIIGTHFYVWFPGDTPEKSLKVAEILNSYKEKHNIKDKPIWDTECGYMWEKITDDERRAGYIARLAVTQWYAGIERVCFYSYDNWYIIRMVDRKYKGENIVGMAFRETQKWLIGSKVLDLINVGNNVWIARLFRNGKNAYMVWHANDNNFSEKQNYKVPDRWEYTEMTNLKGEVKKVPANEVIKIGVAPILVYEKGYF